MIENPIFDRQLWHKANQLCRGDKVHNLKIAMALYKGRFDEGKKNGWTSDLKNNVEMWRTTLEEIVNAL
jgi:hypothetical protein